jgi:ATP-binding cassette subfamily B protein
MKNKGHLRQLIGFYKPFRIPIIACLCLIILMSVPSVIGVSLFGKIIDNANDLNVATKSIFWIMLLALARIITGHVYERVADKYLRYRIVSYANSISMSAMKKMSIGQFRGQDSGKIQSIITKGESSFISMVHLCVFSGIPMIMMILVSLVWLIAVDLKIGFMVFMGCILYGMQTLRMTSYASKKIKKLNRMSNSQNAKFKEILDKSFLIKTSSKEDDVSKKHAARFGRFNHYGERMWLYWDNHNALRNITTEAFIAIVLFVSVWGVVSGEYKPGQIAVFWMLSNRSIRNLHPLSHVHRNIMDNWSKLVDFIDIVNLEPDVKEAENAVDHPRFHGDIHFQNIQFRYPNTGLLEILNKKKKKKSEGQNQDVIKDLTLDIKAGEKVAFVGKSGSGKSTLIQLLLRGYDPQRGTITIDGYDVKKLKFRDLRSQVGVVEQKVELFNGTLLDNLLFALPDDIDKDAIPEEDIMNVCRKARITDFWETRLDRGFRTKIGEDGVMLSGGQRQRVGIARALMKSPDILILDEATSNLDAQTEKHIKEAIDEASVGRTTIIIAHRLSTVKDADKIVVMDKGRIVGVGKHDELSDSCPQYHELVKHQVWD